MDNAEYTEWISNEFNYGGENEIFILAKLNSIQISVVSLESSSILTYGDDPESVPIRSEAKGRIYIIYNGNPSP